AITTDFAVATALLATFVRVVLTASDAVAVEPAGVTYRHAAIFCALPPTILDDAVRAGAELRCDDVARPRRVGGRTRTAHVGVGVRCVQTRRGVTVEANVDTDVEHVVTRKRMVSGGLEDVAAAEEERQRHDGESTGHGGSDCSDLSS